MNSESILSRPTLALVECLRPIASKLRKHLKIRPDPSGPVDDVIGFALRHLEQIQTNIEHLADELNHLEELVEVAGHVWKSLSTTDQRRRQPHHLQLGKRRH